VVIESGVWIGGGSIILGGVRIGRHSVIGAGSVVIRDIRPHSVAVGCPCREIRKISAEPEA
jgi:acetyltransferase-like isoleucine patch superfamily enzyme